MALVAGGFGMSLSWAQNELFPTPSPPFGDEARPESKAQRPKAATPKSTVTKSAPPKASAKSATPAPKKDAQKSAKQPDGKSTGQAKPPAKAEPAVRPAPKINPTARPAQKDNAPPKPAVKDAVPAIPVPRPPAISAPAPPAPPAPAAVTPPPAPAVVAPAPTPPPNRQGTQAADEAFATCLACHGPNGRSETPEIPSLAGLPGPFVTAQLRGLRDGKRKIPAMEAVTGQLTDENLRRFAETIEKLPKLPAPATGYDAKLYETGRALAAAGNCANCHNTGFVGAGTNPSLVHQREDYLIKALRDYKSAARVDQGALMAGSVRNLDDAQMVALAHFLAHLR